MSTVALRDRVQRILTAPGGTDDDRMDEAIDHIAAEVDHAVRRLAMLDPEWELIAREEPILPEDTRRS